jgi:hypothetical protein
MKFRTHICLLLAFFLLVSNVGMVFNVHYCGGKIASISLKPDFQTTSPEENCCGIFEKKASCCKNKVFYFQKKLENTTFTSFSFLYDFTLFIEEWKPFLFSKKLNFKFQNSNSYYCNAHAPPLFKLYHQFIFYA